MWLGIDFGTTNTSAAVYDGNTLNYIALDPLGSSAHNLRSMIYIDAQHRVRLGVDAMQTFLREDTGRTVLLEEKVVGTIENTVASQGFETGEQGGPITIVYDVLVPEDVGIRGRLLQSIKTSLRTTGYRGTQIFGRYYTVEELVAFILGHVRQQAEQQLGHSIHQAVIGRPVTFTGDAQGDGIIEEKLHHAAHLAGFSRIEFLPEPVAAATYYINRTPQEQTFLVFDFGGGTLDLTLLRGDGNRGQQLLSSEGVLVGGDDLDSAIMHGKVGHAFGTQSAIDVDVNGQPIPFPEHLAELLDQWQTIPTLTRIENLEIIQRGIQFGKAKAAFQALETLATKNYGFALFQAIEQTKRELSQEEAATLTLQMEETRLAVSLARGEFNRLIGQERAKVRAGIRAVIAASGLDPEQIDVVVATGGSSSVPAFQALLQSELPGAKMVLSDLFGSVTGGLAIHAYQQQLTTG